MEAPNAMDRPMSILRKIVTLKQNAEREASENSFEEEHRRRHCWNMYEINMLFIKNWSNFVYALKFGLFFKDHWRTIESIVKEPRKKPKEKNNKI